MLNFMLYGEPPATVWRQRKDVRVECPFLYKTPYTLLGPLTLTYRSFPSHHGYDSLSSSIAVPSPLFPTPLSRSSFTISPRYYLPPFNWDLPSRSSPPFLWPTRRAVPLSRVEVWQHRGSGCASRALSPRGGDCGKILMPLTTPPPPPPPPMTTTTMTMVLNRRCGNKLARLPAFTLQESLGRLREKRIIRTSRGNPSATFNQRGDARFNLSSFSCRLQCEEDCPHPQDVLRFANNNSERRR